MLEESHASLFQTICLFILILFESSLRLFTVCQGLLVGRSTSAGAESPRQRLTAAADSELAYTRDSGGENRADSAAMASSGAGDGVEGGVSEVHDTVMKQANYSLVRLRLQLYVF